jgi:hypothetical protein
MSKSVFGIATTQGQAERIVEQLQAQGFGTSEISVLMPDTAGTRDSSRPVRPASAGRDHYATVGRRNKSL